MNDEEMRIYFQAIATNTKATAENLEALRRDLLGEAAPEDKEELPKVEDSDGKEVTL